MSASSALLSQLFCYILIHKIMLKLLLLLCFSAMFRCAGFSALEGAAPVCLPTSQPDASELSTALALQSLAAGRRCNSDDPSLGTAAASRCLYFVTMKPHKAAATAAAAADAEDVSGYFGFKGRLGTPRPSEHSSSTSSTSSGSSDTASGSSTKQQQLNSSSISSSGGDAISGKALSSGCNISSQLVPILVPCPYPQFAEEDVTQETAIAATPGSSRMRQFSVVKGSLRLQQCRDPSSMDLQVVTSVDESLPSAAAAEAAAGGGGIGTGSSTLERVDSQHVLAAAAATCNGVAAPSSPSSPNSSSSSSSMPVFSPRSSNGRRYTAASCGSNIVGRRDSALVDAGGFHSRCARLVCGKLPGLILGGEIAAGTHGRVFRADYNCMKVGCVCLESPDIHFCHEVFGVLKWCM
jgi:hypothetical protein